MALEALALDAGYRLQVVYLVQQQDGAARSRGNAPGLRDADAAVVSRPHGATWLHLKNVHVRIDRRWECSEIHFVYVEQPDSYFHGEYVERWSKVLNRLSAAGFPIWQEGTLTLVIAEMHVQEADGRLREASTFFGGAGTGVSGVAMVTGETLARLSESFLTDNRAYDDLVIPEIGPYPLVQNVSFAVVRGYDRQFHQLECPRWSDARTGSRREPVARFQKRPQLQRQSHGERFSRIARFIVSPALSSR